MTDGVLATIEGWTGARPPSCPWRALDNPFVTETMHAHASYKAGNIAWDCPNPSHKLVTAVHLFDVVCGRVDWNERKLEEEERERARKAAEAARRGRRG